MGITKQVVKALLAENNFKKISGDWLSFGRQTINISIHDLIDICGNADINGLPFDSSTRHGKGSRVSDSAFLEKIFDIQYQTADKSSYEGANIVIDLLQPVDSTLENRYDFIYTGGCLDNVFSPADLIKNSSKMLKVGGRVMHFECASGLLGAFTYLTAEWFMSYYAANNFADCKVYVLAQTKPGRNRFDYDTDIFNYSHEYTRSEDFDYFKSAQATCGIYYILTLAEKGLNSTSDKFPDQLQYIDNNSLDWQTKAAEYSSSKRPLLSTEQYYKVQAPYLSNHFSYRGSGF